MLVSGAENGFATADSFFIASEIVEKAAKHLKRHEMTDAFKLFRLSRREWDLPITEFLGVYL